MTGEDFKRALRRVGLSVYAAAPFLGISPRHCQRIANGEYPAPRSAEILLYWMMDEGVYADYLFDYLREKYPL